MFHVTDGLYFERLDEQGSVRIVKRASALPDAPIVFEQVIDEHSWVSVITEVSLRRDVGFANDLHRGIGSQV